MEIINFADNLPVFATIIATLTLLAVLAVKIIVNDFKALKIEWITLIAAGVVSLIGVTVSRVIVGYQWYYLLIWPVYLLFMFLNDRFNKGKFIGKADLDLFSASLALLVPVVINIMTAAYDGADYVDQVKWIHIQSLIINFLIFVLIGYVLSILQFFIRIFVKKIQHRKTVKEIKEKKEKEQKEKTTIKEKAGKVERTVQDAMMGIAPERPKIFKSKAPVALAFLPLLFYMTYLASAINF